MKNFTQGFAKSILLVAMSSVVFTSCGNTDVASQVTTPAAVGGSNNGGASGGTSNYQPDAPINDYSKMLPAEQAPDQPLDTPEPLPAPQTPAEPGEVFAVKAVGNTTAFAVPKLSKYIQLNGVYVYIHLTWQPVKGAAEYWIYKNTIPAWSEVRRENATAIVEAKDSQGFLTGSLTGYKDGLSAPNLKDGGLWERIKRGFQTITLRPNVDYNYKVVAVDVNGIPMSQSDIATGSAMGAVRSPQMPTKDNIIVGTVTPNLNWSTPESGGLDPDGYYVTVFPSVQGITSGVLPSTSLAAWGTYTKHNNVTHQVNYGKAKSNLLSYVGVLPFDITFDLKPGAKYSWSVVSIRTNAYDMKNATQISRSWGGFSHFQVSSTAKPANPNTEADIVSQNLRNQRVSAQRAPQQRAPYPVYNGQSVPQQQQYPQQQQTYGSQYQQQQYPNQYGGSQYPQQTGYPQQQQRKYY